MFNGKPADEVGSKLKKGLSRMSQQVGGWDGVTVFRGGPEGVLSFEVAGRWLREKGEPI